MSDELARLVEAERARDAKRAEAAQAQQKAVEEYAAARQRTSAKWDIDVQTMVPRVIQALNEQLAGVAVDLALEHKRTDGPILATGMIHVAKNGSQVGELSFEVHENGEMVMRCVIRRGPQLPIGIDDVEDNSKLNILGATDQSYMSLIVRELARFLPQIP